MTTGQSENSDRGPAGRRCEVEGASAQAKGSMNEREFSRRSFLKGGGALVVGLGLASAGFAGKTSASSSLVRRRTASSLPTTLTVATDASFSHLDDQAAVGSGEEVKQFLNYNVTQTLLRLDHNHNLQPLLAESWKITQPGVVQFSLQKGIFFSDGAPWNAAAAQTNFNRMMTLPGSSSYSTEFPSVYQVTVVDPYTIQLSYHPDPDIPFVFATSAMMYSPQQIQNNPSSIAQGPIGTGPYSIQNFNIATGMTLVAGDTYFGKRTQIKTVNFNFIGDEGARTAALKAGQADLVINLQPSDVSSFPKDQVVFNEGYEIYNIRFGLHDPLSNDHRVREAISLAIDRSALIKLFSGYATAAQGYQLWPSWVTGAFKQPVVKQNVSQAKALIQQAGATGKTVTMICPTVRYPGLQQVAEAIQNMVQQIGLSVNLQEIDYNDWLVVTREVTAPTTMIFGSFGYDTGFDATTNLVKKVMCGGVNSTFCDPQFDYLADEAINQTDSTKRAPIIKQLTHILAHEIPYIPLVNPATIYGKAAKLSMQTYPNGFLAFANMHWNQ